MLLALNVASHAVKFGCKHNYVFGLVPLFSFDGEANVPTFYSALSLLFSSILLLIISICHKRQTASYIPWLVLSIIFLCLAIDEVGAIHEEFSAVLRSSLDTTGLLFFAWVIPYGIGLIVFVICYLRFLLRLPGKTRTLFIVSGAMFVTGAIGFEMLGGRHLGLHGGRGIGYALLYTGEELLEMIGIATFIYALLAYIVAHFESLSVTVSEHKRIDE